MEVFVKRMPHIVEEIFEHLDTKSLIMCKEVSKPWKDLIERKKLSWIQFVNIRKTLRDRNTYFILLEKLDT